MPDYIFHLEIGKEIYLDLPHPIVDIIGNYHNEYVLGLEGPDLFFYRAFLPGKVRRLSNILGNKLHKEKFSIYSGLILHGLKDSDNKLKDQLFSYFAGFFIHLFTDLFFHPYIRYRTQELKKKIDSPWTHKLFEMYLDLSYVTYKTGSFSPLPYVNSLVRIRGFPEDVALFFAKAIKRAYDLNVDIYKIIPIFSQSYKIMRFALSFFERPDILRRYFIYPLVYMVLSRGRYVEFLTHPQKEELEDVLNIEHKDWIHLDISKRYTQSILDLVDRFKVFSHGYIEDMYNFIYRGGVFPEVFIKNYSFSKGVIYGREDEKVSWVF